MWRFQDTSAFVSQCHNDRHFVVSVVFIVGVILNIVLVVDSVHLFAFCEVLSGLGTMLRG